MAKQVNTNICPWWLAWTFDNPLRSIFHVPKEILTPYVKEGMTVLDVGCGMGYFSIDLANLVGEQGIVIATDVQQKMLDVLQRRAEGIGISDRIRIHRCTSRDLGTNTKVDFILAFWMVHEVPNVVAFFNQIQSSLKPKGKILVAEPMFHVSSKRFQEILSSARESGLIHYDTPKVRFSRSVVLQKKD